ncbi:MAG: hypothetical protein FVQ81_15865 [Candidatus Glassbacteria bacterium]|nr:hypothetical protein [Candidatus Glassbacteria bacterium]
MIRRMIETGLAILLALPLHVFGAETARNGQPAGEVEAAGELRSLAENIRLGRAVREFAEEFALFDTQLYGRLQDNESQQVRMQQLSGEISDANQQIDQAMEQIDHDRIDLIGGGFEGMTPAERAIIEEVKQLESDVAAMEQRMNELHALSPLPATSELLDASRWEDLLYSGSTRDLLELIESTLNVSVEAGQADSAAPDK